MVAHFDSMNSFEDIAHSINIGIFDYLHTGVAFLSNEGKFIYCNKAYLEMFKLSKKIIGQKVSDVFITGEQGAMRSIRSQKIVVSTSLTVDNEQGISFRYPVKDNTGKLCGIIIESIPLNLGPEKLKTLMESVHNLEVAAMHFEQTRSKQTGRFFTFADIVGESDALMEMKRLGKRFAASNEPIMLYGESGSGKELVAQALHMASPRANKTFVSVNCAAMPAELIESELFGYARGAFTGAREGGLIGKFEMANGGTIFFDEIGELPLATQAKLLRVLESGEIQKIAHRGTLYSDFRLIGATNRNLRAMVDEKAFREDLYHRLNIFEITVPPLRDRQDDIPLLTRYFIEQCVGGQRANDIRVSNEVFELFSRHRWPGNIRELKNVLTYALYSLTDESILRSEHLPARFLASIYEPGDLTLIDDMSEKSTIVKQKKQDNSYHLSAVSAEAEKEAILKALEKCHYKKSLVAKMLGISRTKLYKKLHDYNILNDQDS